MTPAIGFSTPKKWNPVSALIRRIMGSDFSHTWMMVYDQCFKRWMVIEASDFGLRAITIAKFMDSNRVVRLIQPQWDLQPGLTAMVDELGDSYDFPGLFATPVVLLGRWLKRKWHNPIHSAHSMFCSEAIMRALKVSNYPGTVLWEPEDTTPMDIYEMFLKNNEKPTTVETLVALSMTSASEG